MCSHTTTSDCPTVSPYLKSLSMVAANKLLHLLEAFSTTWFLFSAAQNHHLVFFLLEAFNNIIQYQFDGKKNMRCGRCVSLREFKNPSFYCIWRNTVCLLWCSKSAPLSVSSRELQPGLRNHPQTERFPPVGQPAVRRCLHPEGFAEEEEVSRRHFPHQLPGDYIHGGLSPCCTRRTRYTEGQSSRNSRCVLLCRW